MGMAANMAAIVAAALLEHGTSGEAGLLYVSCLSRAPNPTFVTCLGKGIEWIDAGAPGVGAGSGPPSSGLLYVSCLSGPEPYTCLGRQGNEAESDVAAPGRGSVHASTSPRSIRI